MKVKIISDIEIFPNDRIYKKGQEVEVQECHFDDYYETHFKINGRNTFDYIPKQAVIRR